MSLRKIYFNAKRKQEFNPKFLGIFINPFYFARKRLYDSIKELAKEINGGSLLDVGCGTKPYKELFNVEKYDGLEIITEEYGDLKEAEFFYDGKTFPFENNSYDNILCNEVLEHVFNPDEFLCEIHRVLKSDGKLLLTVPFVWFEHEPPYDYGRYSSYGLKYLLEAHGFEIIKYKKSSNTLETISQLLNGYIVMNFMFLKRMRIFNYIFTDIFCSISTLFALIFGKIFPKGELFYLDNVVLAKKIKD